MDSPGSNRGSAKDKPPPLATSNISHKKAAEKNSRADPISMTLELVH
jgi:hypothetical protein